MIRSYQGHEPRVAEDCYLAPGSRVIGDVTIGSRSSVWFNAVIRGDVAPITIGNRTNVQDNSVLHSREKFPISIGDGVTLGHGVRLHGSTIGDHTLIGIGSVLLDGATVEEGTIVAAGSLVPSGTTIPSGCLAMGTPVEVRRKLTEEERQGIDQSAEAYVGYSVEYRRTDGTASGG